VLALSAHALLRRLLALLLPRLLWRRNSRLNFLSLLLPGTFLFLHGRRRLSESRVRHVISEQFNLRIQNDQEGGREVKKIKELELKGKQRL
jgi:hypothetical protein